MATWNDVEAAATPLPEVDRLTGRDGRRAWKVRGKHFVWERPLRKSDLTALGAPTGPILGVCVADLTTKDVLLTARPAVCFTTPHFVGYKAVLVRLDVIEPEELAPLVEDAWLARAPKRLARAYREATGDG